MIRNSEQPVTPGPADDSQSPVLLTVTQAAERLNLTRQRVAVFCQEGRLGRKVGSVYIISQDELDEFASKDREPGNPHFRAPE